MDSSNAVRATPRGATITLTVVPRSGRNQVVGVEGDAIKIRLKAPPVEGKANEELLRYLADCLDVPLTSLHIVAGTASRHKVVAVEGLTPHEVWLRIERC